MEFEDDEFIKTLEVSYQPTVVNSVAVVTDKGNFKRWGINNGEIKTWNFSSEYELIGLFGNETPLFGIASLGIIVFKPEICREEVDQEEKKPAEEPVDDQSSREVDRIEDDPSSDDVGG